LASETVLVESHRRAAWRSVWKPEMEEAEPEVRRCALSSKVMVSVREGYVIIASTSRERSLEFFAAIMWCSKWS
jgi:hypothetical protein